MVDIERERKREAEQDQEMCVWKEKLSRQECNTKTFLFFFVMDTITVKK
jgi:hypothetical protein